MKENFKGVLIERAIGYLKAEQLELESQELFPDLKVYSYKELPVERDEKTLIQLENDLRLLKLTEAKIEDLLKLITNLL